MALGLAHMPSFMPWVHAQVKADPNAPKNQQATVLNSANGTPLINIQTPSAAGVSRNTYSQFDVNAQGAILNNSRTDTSTQLGGWVQANPWLAKGGARVILNEVNSSQPSQLKGMVEVAGKRAELIIANPSGIQVDGAGFINASSAVLTTGTTQFGSDGAITGFAVQGGRVRVEGQGLDARQTDYTTILARAVEINAGIWAQDLRMGLGTQTFQADLTRSVMLSPDASAATPVRYALDSSVLGGIYAQRITLVGTEAGLGVRNAGTWSAQQLHLNSEGWLDNSGTLYAQDPSGVGSAPALDVQMSQGIANQGWMVSRGGARLQALQVRQTPDGVMAAGLQRDATLAAAGGEADLRIGATQTMQLAGQLLASDRVVLQGDAQAVPLAGGAGAMAPHIDLQGVTLVANEALLSAQSAALANANLSAQATLSVQVQGLLEGRSAHLSAQQMSIRAGDIDAYRSQWTQWGGRSLSITVPGRFNLDGAEIGSNGESLSLSAREFSGQGMAIRQLGGGSLSVQAQAVDLGQAQLLSRGGVDLRAGTLRLDQANTQGSAINIAADRLSHRAGVMRTTGAARLELGEFDNQAGLLEADSGVTLAFRGTRYGTAPMFSNMGGTVQSAQGSLFLSSDAAALASGAAIDNSSGWLSAKESLSVQAGTFNQARGAGVSGRDVEFRTTGLWSQDAGEASSRSSVQASGGLIVRSGTLRSEGALHASGHASFFSQGDAMLGGTAYSAMRLEVLSGRDLSVQGLVSGLGDVSLTSQRELRITDEASVVAGMNADGRLVSPSSARGQLSLDAGETLQAQGTLLSAQAVTLRAAHELSVAGARLQALSADAQGRRLDLSGTQWNVAGHSHLAAEQDLNTSGAQLQTQTLRVSAQNWRNTSGLVQVAGGEALSVALPGVLDNTAGRLLSNAATFSLQAQKFLNDRGVVGAGGGGLELNVDSLSNRLGTVAGEGALKVRAGRLDNSEGQLSGADVAVRIAQGLINGGQGLVASRSNLQLQAGSLDTEGTLQARGNVSIAIAANANLRGTLLAQGRADVSVGGTLNLSGALAAQGNLSVKADRLISTGQLAAGAMSTSVAGEASPASSLTVRTAQTLQHSGTSVATGAVELSGEAVDLAGSTTQGLSARLQARSGELRLKDTQLAVSQGLKLESPSQLTTDGAALIAGSVDLQAKDWSHKAGRLLQTRGEGLAQLTVQGTLDNSEGMVNANARTLVLEVANLVNNRGQLLHAGSDRLNLNVNALQGRSGSILSNGFLQLAASGDVDLDGASTQARTVQVQANSLSHQGGRLLSQDALSLQVVGSLNNLSGVLSSPGPAFVSAARLDNSDGQITGQRLVARVTDEFINGGAGVLAAQDALHIDAGSLRNTGAIQSGGDVQLRTLFDLHNSGSVYAQGSGLLQVGGELSHQGVIAAQRDLSVQAGQVASHGNWAAGLRPDGGLAASGRLLMNVSQDLQHSGLIRVATEAKLQASSLNLSGSQSQAQSIAFDAGMGPLILDRAVLVTPSSLTMNTPGDLSTVGSTLQVGSLAVHADNWNLASTTLQQTDVKGRWVAEVKQNLDSRAGRFAVQATDLTLQAGQWLHEGGVLEHVGSGQARISADRVNAKLGTVVSNGELTLASSGTLVLDGATTQGQRVTLQAAQLSHRGGKLLATQDVLVKAAQVLDNAGGAMSAGTTLTLHAGSLDNSEGQVIAQGSGAQALSAQVDGGLVNGGQGLIASQGG
ncbi:filamentous hemagglutinin N-terminal domain-containing protein, partial [Pelomonas sp. CA6]|uniref:filamentous hemagglutinin N-terminal domain-containing protein n=1 Tax=Pelomonas sp. CA6 TaxID=2907999 RepID=UPI001F4C1AFE